MTSPIRGAIGPYLSRYFKIVRPDVRGLGLSSADFDIARDFNFDACVGDLTAIVDALGAESVHYCGESMGGILGLAFAATQPKRVRTLTLVSTPVQLRSGLGQTIRDMGGVAAWNSATNRSFRFPPDTDPGLLDWYQQELVRNRPEVQLAMAGLVEGVDVASYLPRIEAPVLGLYPTGGEVANDEQARLLTTHIRNLRLVHLPTSYHKVQLVFPATCATHVLHFASQHDGTACHES
jgi:3-oxoadipate enol-lactonase